MRTQAEVVVIGAGIVGCSAAHGLAQRSWRDIVVLEQGPLFATGGSTSHAPGLIFQTNSSQTMCQLAQASVQAYSTLAHDDQSCFHAVGSLEVAYTRARWEDLHRRQGYARSWGLTGELISPTEAHSLLPLLDAAVIHGAYYVPSDGVAHAVRAAEGLAMQAQASGVHFYGGVEVTGINVRNGHVQGVTTVQGTIVTERVLVCAGIWGPRIGRMVGVALPLTPVQHQYARTGPLPELRGETREIGQPVVRHQDKRMYFRQHADSYGIGSYAHAPILTRADDIRRHADSPVMPSIMPFTPDDFRQPWQDAVELLPALGGVEIAHAFNGMFSFTPDGLPLIGESAAVRGFWVAEAVWVTQGAGVGAQVAAWLTDGAPEIDLRECNLNHFEAFACAPAYVRARGAQQYREIYDIIHPLQQIVQPRPLRCSPFYRRQQELGAVFFEARGWERPQWYAEQRSALNQPKIQNSKFTRTGWAAQNWSPMIAAEHAATREQVALFDMTPLARCEISGSGALAMLQALATNDLDRPIGSITYTAMVNDRGGVLSDITVTRLAENQFWIAHNGPNDLAYFQQRCDTGGQIAIRDCTGGTCCIGVWGPQARALVQPLSDDDLANAAFPYLTAQRIFVGEIPVLALRVSYVGELGWELYTSSEYGLRLWDMLWQAGQPLGVVAGGRGAFDSLRLEKGYRLYGSDMHTGYDPYEAGIGFTVKLNKGAFRGHDALAERKAVPRRRKLCCLIFDNPAVIALGKEPVYAAGQVAGYVTSANFGYSVGRSIAYSYLPMAYAQVGVAVEIAVGGVRQAATVATEPLFDPKGERLRM